MANINKNIIMQAGAAVANATNKAAGISASTPEPGTIISAIQLVNGGRTVGPAALAHFAESVRNKLLSLLMTMEPIQDLHGYDKPWAPGDGKNLINPALYDWQSKTTPNGLTYTVQNDGSIHVSGTASSAGGATIIEPFIDLPDGTYYTYDPPSGEVRVSYRKRDKITDSTSVLGSNFTVNDAFRAQYDIYIGVWCNAVGTYDTTIYPMIQEGAPITSWSPYSNICPITGRTGLIGYVGPTSAIGDATAYSMDWTTPAGTVYAGSADIVTGDIKAAPYYASYNGETLVGPWVSSMDAYDPEGTPTTGAQVVDLGGTMTEYHITGQDIITLVGDNYIWSDSGDVTITE